MTQYWTYLTSIVTKLDFGPSLKQRGQTVIAIISDGMKTSVKLGLIAAALALILGTVLGSFAALRRNKAVDKVIMSENNNERPLVEIKHLKEYFDVNTGFFKSKPLKAVDDVSFSIKKGETLGLVGESGCGKTTVGRTILQLYKPTAGEIWYDGKQVKTAADLQEFRKKATMMHAAEDLLMSTGTICPLYYYTDLYMVSKKVKGFFASPLGYKFFMYTTVTE